MSSPTPSSGRSRVAQQIRRELTERIAGGVYKPDAYLPPERDLAQEFRTSRSTIAEALVLLRQDGLVSEAGKRGTRVRCPAERLHKSLIGVIHSPYDPTARGITDAGAMVEGICEVLDSLGYPYEDTTVYRQQITTDRITARFGAVVFIETFRMEEMILELERQRIPLVVANLEVDLDVSATCADHRRTMLRAVKTLTALGHRRIAFLGRDPKWKFYGKSCDGYLEGLA